MENIGFLVRIEDDSSPLVLGNHDPRRCAWPLDLRICEVKECPDIRSWGEHAHVIGNYNQEEKPSAVVHPDDTVGKFRESVRKLPSGTAVYFRPVHIAKL